MINYNIVVQQLNLLIVAGDGAESIVAVGRRSAEHLPGGGGGATGAPAHNPGPADVGGAAAPAPAPLGTAAPHEPGRAAPLAAQTGQHAAAAPAPPAAVPPPALPPPPPTTTTSAAATTSFASALAARAHAASLAWTPKPSPRLPQGLDILFGI